ncbi:hypothetical protein [Paenibacillus naphthalenovorans]|nr:hypothetical protein [Paenibacillus naphthalenovorans]
MDAQKKREKLSKEKKEKEKPGFFCSSCPKLAKCTFEKKQKEKIYSN